MATASNGSTRHCSYIGLLLLLVIITVASLGYTYGAVANLSSQNTNLSNQNDNLRSQIGQLSRNVTNLTNQVDSLKSGSVIATPITLVNGQATCSTSAPYEIRFDSPQTQTLSSVVFSANNYKLYLPTNVTYDVFI